MSMPSERVAIDASHGQEGTPSLIRFNPHPSPRLRLFCFPYAGGDANVFRSWVAGMPGDVEVVGVQYPGRGLDDPARAIASCERMAVGLLDVMTPWLGRPFVFFGHSNGALISFEVARRLGAHGRSLLRHHLLSARVPAHLPTGRGSISRLDDGDFLRVLANMGGTPSDVLRDKSIMKLVMPRLRADFALGETYVFAPGSRLGCDITTLHGQRDEYVDGALVPRWSELTDGDATHHVLPGDHFFIHALQERVLAVVRDALLKAIRTDQAHHEL